MKTKKLLFNSTSVFLFNLIVIVLLCFIATASYAQDTLPVSWFITRDGPASQADYAWGVDVDENGNIYWSTSQKVSGLNEKDIFTYKLDPSGNELWAQPHVFGGLYEHQAYNAVYKNGVLYVGGRVWSCYYNLNCSDALLYALDSLTKDTLWTWIWDGGYAYEEIDGIAIEDDGIYISGWTQDSINNMDVFVAKLDFNGNTQWLVTWGSPNHDTADGHCVVDDSSVYVSGMYNSSGWLLNGKAHVTAFDRHTGAYKWHVLWGGAGQEDGLGLNSDGTYLYQCGITSSHGDSTVFINKYDKNSNLLWTVLTDKVGRARSLDFCSNGYLYLAGTTYNLGAGGEDLIVMTLDTANGQLLNYKTWGGSENESVHDIKIIGNYMYLTGRTVSFSTNNHYDALLIKAPLFTVTNTLDREKESTISIFPNPFSDYVTIAFENPTNESFTLEVYTIQGALVRTIEKISGNRIVVQKGELSKGLYIFKLKGFNNDYTGKFIVN